MDETALTDKDELQAKLAELMIEHRDLDDSIDALIKAGAHNQLQIQRLKKRKLGLKDQIELIRNKLIPDIIA